jgi:putative ABC transport system permease protein
VVSPALAGELAVEIGDDLELENPPLTVTIVGEAERTTCLSCDALHLQGDLGRFTSNSPFITTLIDLPPGLSVDELTEVQAASGSPLRIRELALADHRAEVDGDEAIRWTLVLGAVVLTVVGIVISAAFAVGARRQLVTIGQLSAAGTPPSSVRAALMLQGTVTGLIGTVIGGLLAAGVLTLGEARLERVIDQRIHGYELHLSDLVRVGLIGILAATMAALLPARTAAGIPTLAALAGRRPLSPVSRRQLAWGTAGVAGGLALLFLAVLGGRAGDPTDVWGFVAIGGGVAELLGACAVAPAVVARLEPLAARLRGGLRLGARSLARNRARTGAVVSAVAAAGALAVIGGAVLLAEEHRRGERLEIPDDVVVVGAFAYGEDAPDPSAALTPALRREVRELLPGAEELSLRTAPAVDPAPLMYWEAIARGDDGRGSSETAAVVDEDLLDAMRASGAVRAALDEYGVVALSPGGEHGITGDVQIVLPDQRRVPGAIVVHPHTFDYRTTFLITEQLVDELHLTTAETALVYDLPRSLTGAQRDRLDELQWDLEDRRPASVPFVGIDSRSPDQALTQLEMELLLATVALVFSLFVVGVSLALAAAESKDERDVLTIVGAPPGALARSAGARAWLLSVIGTAMAVPIGFLPVMVVSRASAQGGDASDRYPVLFPTRTVLLLVVAVPLVVAAVSWIASGAAQRLRPVRVSTATFE